MSTQILVPLDGSELAEQALPVAVTLAKATGSTLILLRVLPPVSEVVHRSATTDGIIEKAGALREALSEYYFNSVQKRLSDAGVHALPRLEEGIPGDVIARVAEEESVRYVVMTTHGHTGIRRWAIGSVADRVLRQVRTPLILLHPREPHPANIARTIPLENLFVPLDGSSFSEAVLPEVRELARLFGSTIHLFHAVAPITWGLSATSGRQLEMRLLELEERESQEYLAGLAATLTSEGFSVRTRVQKAHAADAILARAAECSADLIIMSTHGRTGIKRALLGSVTDRVVRAGETPVLVVPPPLVPQEAQDAMMIQEL